MGNEHSSIPGFEPLQSHEQFTASVLLIDAPPAFHGFDLSERKWLLLRSIALSIVRWDSKLSAALTADQLRLVLNKHAAVVIFDSGLGLMRGGGAISILGAAVAAPGSQDPTTASAIKHLSNVLSQVTKGQSDRTRYKLVPLRVANAIGLFEADMESHASEYVKGFTLRCNIMPDVAGRLEWWHPGNNDDVARFVIGEVLAAETQTVPKDLQRPLKSLLADLVEAVDAREGHLFESSTLFPLSSAGNDNPNSVNNNNNNNANATGNGGHSNHISSSKLKHRALNLSQILRRVALPILSSTQSHIRFANFRVGVDTVVYLATVVPNTLFVALVLRDGGSGVGEALVRLNCAHFAQHFTHVVTSTSKIDHRIEPLPPPMLGNQNGENSDEEED
jgi:hypothetical protein